MKRLTYRVNIGGSQDVVLVDKKNVKKCLKWKDTLKRLAEYEDLEEQGKLLKLPCAVGDTVYCIYSRYTKCSAHNEEFEESTCQGCESECDSKREYYINEQRAYSLDWIVAQIVNKHFGKLVFLTKKEAEVVLKEMRV